ncbi:hypothetical protein [Chitinophaga agri]|uniref:Uncharacterized protein n=1 Tax=Chitinophaga agri TaxID=2703787 RepID=A0A6B9ZDW9_9BACT|nr:hypothetical protein [Chitinophaga agri]QHS60558.1 hypothetical protein GWR21_13440 [Chitinophaga agri]
MKALPPQHSFRFHNLGIGEIQLGKKPEKVPGMLPFPTYGSKDFFRIHPNEAHYHAFAGNAKGMIERDDTGIDLRHLITSMNESGFINRIFLYPQGQIAQLACRLSQLYGEPFAYKLPAGVRNVWITNSETEITLFTPEGNAIRDTVITFRFFHDLVALKEYIIEGST